MNPAAEQLVRDYLNRVSVAARDRLSPEDRRAFLARMREVIERSTGGARAGRGEVRKLLSGFGDPAALVDHECARLAAVRGQPRPESAAQRPGTPPRRRGSRLAALSGPPPGFLVPRPSSPADDAPPGDAPADAEQDRARRGRSARTPAARPGDSPAGPPGPLPPAGRRGRPEHPAWPSAAVTGPLGDERTAPAGDQPGQPRSPRGLSGLQQRDGRRPRPRTDLPPGASPRAAQGSAGDDLEPAARGAAAAAVAGLGAMARQLAAVAARRPLEFCAIAILGLGGLIFPPVWLIGALMAPLSRIWDLRDKWVGLGGPLLLVIVGSLAAVAVGGQHASAGGYVHEAWASATYLSRIGAVLGAAYLAWRLRRGRRVPGDPPWHRSQRPG